MQCYRCNIISYESSSKAVIDTIVAYVDHGLSLCHAHTHTHTRIYTHNIDKLTQIVFLNLYQYPQPTTVLYNDAVYEGILVYVNVYNVFDLFPPPGVPSWYEFSPCRILVDMVFR